ncbi:hypothetical protein DICVIV_13960 [Dictyocaulus viviparus]|uniref:Uncharacterized protein n=1 Tax=Dictyocaulus viviparus TaxID=29172 RepID=A0A0D8XCB1_DICVI|nr:hypothetical protein DICVIV_13960 [Dictyocaulus viviparus]
MTNDGEQVQMIEDQMRYLRSTSVAVTPFTKVVTYAPSMLPKDLANGNRDVQNLETEIRICCFI